MDSDEGKVAKENSDDDLAEHRGLAHSHRDPAGQLRRAEQDGEPDQERGHRIVHGGGGYWYASDLIGFRVIENSSGRPRVLRGRPPGEARRSSKCGR